MLFPAGSLIIRFSCNEIPEQRVVFRLIFDILLACRVEWERSRLFAELVVSTMNGVLSSGNIALIALSRLLWVAFLSSEGEGFGNETMEI